MNWQAEKIKVDNSSSIARIKVIIVGCDNHARWYISKHPSCASATTDWEETLCSLPDNHILWWSSFILLKASKEVDRMKKEMAN